MRTCPSLRRHHQVQISSSLALHVLFGIARRCRSSNSIHSHSPSSNDAYHCYYFRPFFHFAEIEGTFQLFYCVVFLPSSIPSTLPALSEQSGPDFTLNGGIAVFDA